MFWRLKFFHWLNQRVIYDIMILCGKDRDIFDLNIRYKEAKIGLSPEKLNLTYLDKLMPCFNLQQGVLGLSKSDFILSKRKE